MGELFFSRSDVDTIDQILKSGLEIPKGHKWQALRFALARSLQIVEPPGKTYDAPPSPDRKSELLLEQVTGEGKGPTEDFTDVYRLLLSEYHGVDLFRSRKEFVENLQRHLRRGLDEIRRSWRDGNDFHDYLFQEFYYDQQAEVPVDEHRDTLLTILKKLGVRATIREVAHGPRLTRYTLHLEGGDDLDRLRRELAKIPFELGFGEGISATMLPGERIVALDIPRPERTWSTVGWGELVDAVHAAPDILPVCPGTDILGRPFIFDLAEAPHLFVAGTTGSGKSLTVHALILSLLASKRLVQLALIDPKRVEFMAYNRLGPRLWGENGIAVEVDAAEQMLADLVEEMEQRQQVLAELGVANLAEAQARGSDLQRIVLVVEEVADLVMQRDTTLAPLIRLAQKARSAGIHLILTTQRPEAETFPGLLRTNIPSRIALTVQKSQDSRIILDESGAEKLLMKGDMLVRLAGHKTIRAHGAKVTTGDIAAAVR
jgi:S-DNA-T family DNA segregation ATPase FtsK/SpoIIIE